MDERHHRLARARKDAGFKSSAEAARRFNWSLDTTKSNENGNATFSFARAKEYAEAYGVRAEWLYDGVPPMRPAKDERLVNVLGRVGANPEGSLRMATADPPTEWVPMPPGGTAKTVALLVVGDSMPDVAEDGSLIYFERQDTPPTEDMIGRVVVVETDEDEVLVKRLLRGTKKGLYDLESIVGGTRKDVRIRWAARIIATVPAHQARKVIRTDRAA